MSLGNGLRPPSKGEVGESWSLACRWCAGGALSTDGNCLYSSRGCESIPKRRIQYSLYTLYILYNEMINDCIQVGNSFKYSAFIQSHRGKCAAKQLFILVLQTRYGWLVLLCCFCQGLYRSQPPRCLSYSCYSKAIFRHRRRVSYALLTSTDSLT